MFAYPVAVLLAIVAWFFPVRLPVPAKAVVGSGLAGFGILYLVTQMAEPDVTHPGAIPAILVGGPLVLGGVLYIGGVAMQTWTRTGKWLEVLGLLLAGAVFAVPSMLVLFLPAIAIILVSAVRADGTSASSHEAQGTPI